MPTNTSAWSKRRARWAARLPLPCYRCGQPINPWDQWDLDHRTPAALGGSDADTRPSHRTCNRQAGGQLANELHRLGAARARQLIDAATAVEVELESSPDAGGFPAAPSTAQ